MFKIIYPSGMEIIYNKANLVEAETEYCSLYHTYLDNGVKKKVWQASIQNSAGAIIEVVNNCGKKMPIDNTEIANKILALPIKRRTAHEIKRILNIK